MTSSLLAIFPRSRGVRAVLLAAVSGLALGAMLLPSLPRPGEAPPAPPEVRFLGAPLALDDRAQAIALERLRRFAGMNLQLVLPGGRTRELSLGRLGAQIDKGHLSSLVRQARDGTSVLRRAFAQSGRPAPLELPVPIVLEPRDATNPLLRVKDEVDRVAVDARFDLDARKVLPETEGLSLDLDATWLAISHAVAEGRRRVEVVVQHQSPRRTAKDLGHVDFSTVLGVFETHYDSSAKSLARTYNLRQAASKLDGTVLLPGELFDFNEVVGPRDEANGYKVATVIAEGELVDGLGGGTCQISGTLHGAVFFSGLEVAYRIPHTRPSSYIKMGLDATVVYPTINFKFRNPFDFPIVVHETVKNGLVRAEILGPERRHQVTLIRRITGTAPYEELEREDEHLPRGTRLLAQRGVAGFTVNRYRIVREGSHATRERWTDKYPPTPQIIRVGTGTIAKDEVKAEDDRHPEYLADELLVMTQGTQPEGEERRSEQPKETTDGEAKRPARREDGGAQSGAAEPARAPNAPSSSEWRESGRTGEPGWTEREHMPQWQGDPKRPKDEPKPERDGKRDRRKPGRRGNG